MSTDLIEYCAHDWSLTGGEGPADALGRPVILWNCDTCGAAVVDALPFVITNFGKRTWECTCGAKGGHTNPDVLSGLASSHLRTHEPANHTNGSPE